MIAIVSVDFREMAAREAREINTAAATHNPLLISFCRHDDLVTGYRYHNYKALIRTIRALIEI